MGSNQQAILKTLIYSDIFDFPLTQEEIYRLLIAEKKTTQKIVDATLASLPHIEKKDGYYFFSGREDIVRLRLERERESKKKLVLAQKIGTLLSWIPSVLLIAVSGGVAVLNAKADDDIDLFIITKRNTLWTTRLFILAILTFLGKRRGKGETHVANKFCVNMLLDETALAFPKERQTLYTAHEILQLHPVFERDTTYAKFWNANKWVSGFLPNVVPAFLFRQKNSNFLVFFSVFSFQLFESIAKYIQLRRIKKHVTKETIADNFLAFHPFAYNEWVMKEYKKRIKEYSK